MAGASAGKVAGNGVKANLDGCRFGTLDSIEQLPT
jgi:hypothetical protein